VGVHVYDVVMLAGVLEAIDEVVIPVVCRGDDLIDVLTARDRLDAVATSMLIGFETHEQYRRDEWNSPSMHSWLVNYGRRSDREARSLLSFARWMAAQPDVARVYLEGELVRGQVDAIRVNVPKPLADLFAEHAPFVVPDLVGLSVRDTADAMRDWRAKAEAVIDPPEPTEPPESLFVSKLLDGRREINGHLDAINGKYLEHAIALADSGDYAVPASKRRAEALGAIARFYLEHRDTPTGRRNRPHFNLVLDAQTAQAWHIGGERVGLQQLRTLLDDATITRVLTAKSVEIDRGVEIYAVSPPIWDAVVLRDQGCRGRDCNAPPEHCHAHHVIAYPHGPTAVDNIVLYCGRDHRTTHKPGWSTRLEPNGTIHITDPAGHTTTSHARGPTPHQHAKRKRATATRTRAERQTANDSPNAPPLRFDG
jgi:hypothetical protein